MATAFVASAKARTTVTTESAWLLFTSTTARITGAARCVCIFRFDFIDNGFALIDNACAKFRATLRRVYLFSEETKLIVKGRHYALFSLLGLRLAIEIGPRSMMPFSAKRRRTVSDGCPPLESHSLAFSSLTTTV